MIILFLIIVVYLGLGLLVVKIMDWIDPDLLRADGKVEETTATWAALLWPVFPAAGVAWCVKWTLWGCWLLLRSAGGAWFALIRKILG
jgi:hypothetical protein